ncbi:MAG: LarC family nickel insertion protein [Humidesulfovibrio sp.]|uniref:LarC family nickel insertion protein n=1 Tax=Humidesulfovibrio sp. TaxID=2910988 RepID=UPI0027324D8E|nr:LarC family nickel insertion protein [Humidesulfovibrio sp.]MDP2848243.1 LarC family nickel insertion protein [Humidesulfovibrio sp.]
MKTLYLECSLGVSGDMLLASLSDLLPGGEQILSEAVAALGLPGVSIRTTEQMVQGIRTRRVEVLEEAPQPLRHLKDLTDIVMSAPESHWPAEVKELGLTALTRLAEAESKVHGEPLEQIHFHEVGAVDTVVDALGAVLLARATGAGRVLVSPVNLGSGFVTFSHGRFPVPAPASAELARGMRTFATDSGMELATPTGLAVLKTLADAYGPLPLGSIHSLGYGSGTYSTGAYPTFLRAYLLEAEAGKDHKHQGQSGHGTAYYGPHGHEDGNQGQGRHVHAKQEHEHEHEHGHVHRHQGRHGGHDHD